MPKLPYRSARFDGRAGMNWISDRAGVERNRQRNFERAKVELHILVERNQCLLNGRTDANANFVNSLW